MKSNKNKKTNKEKIDNKFVTSFYYKLVGNKIPLIKDNEIVCYCGVSISIKNETRVVCPHCNSRWVKKNTSWSRNMLP